MAKLSSCNILPSLKLTVRTLEFDGWNVPIFQGKLLGSERILIMMIALFFQKSRTSTKFFSHQGYDLVLSKDVLAITS